MRLTGALNPGVTATDMTLRIVEILREHGVVGKFVEFFGPGMVALSLADRATIANMAPEYGATCGFFPVDGRTLEYLNLTGREDEHVVIIGSGIGGPARYLADRSGARVLCVELQKDVHDVAVHLTGRLSLIHI